MVEFKYARLTNLSRLTDCVESMSKNTFHDSRRPEELAGQIRGLCEDFKLRASSTEQNNMYSMLNTKGAEDDECTEDEYYIDETLSNEELDVFTRRAFQDNAQVIYIGVVDALNPDNGHVEPEYDIFVGRLDEMPKVFDALRMMPSLQAWILRTINYLVRT